MIKRVLVEIQAVVALAMPVHALMKKDALLV